MSLKEFEDSHHIAPLKNSVVMHAQANLLVTPVGTSYDLRTLFGTGIAERGHFLTLKAECPTGTGKVFVAFGSSPGQIDPMETGVTTGVCYPLLDMLPERFQLTGGFEQGSGVATNIAIYSHLHVRGPSFMPSGFLRLQWSSLAPSQNSSEFCP
jgi:hypothetical protein